MQKIEDPWKALSDAIEETFSAKETTYNTELIQKACNDLVEQKEFDKLEKGLEDILKKHFEEWHDQLKKLDDDLLLNKLSDQYENYKNISSLIPVLYSPYNQHFNSDSKTADIIRKLYIQIILSDDQLIKGTTTPSILKVILNAQKGSDVDLSKAKNIIQMYYSFSGENDKPEIFSDFYEKLEEQEIKFCEDFYNNNFKSSSFTAYLISAQRQFIIINNILNEKQLLEEQEAQDILTEFNASLLSSRENDFLEGETPLISTVLTGNDLSPMKYLVDTYENFEFDIKPLYEACAHYIKNEMLKKAHDFEKTSKKRKICTLVGSLIELTLNLIEPYRKVFANEVKYNPACKELDECVAEAWNDYRFDMAVNFNGYIDALVKSKFRGYDSKIEAEKLITIIIPQFYQYLNDKRKFDFLFENSFVHRLAIMRQDVEQYDLPIIISIQKLNHNFMSNIDKFKEAIIDSNRLSEKYMDAYPESYNNIKINPLVFNQNSYPLPEKEFNIIIPPFVAEENMKFKDFYHSEHPNKKLQLVYQDSFVEISLKVASGRKYTLLTDLPCATIIFALSLRQHRFDEIIELLGNDRSLASKALMKLLKISLIISTKQIVTAGDNFFIINPSFSNVKSRIIIDEGSHWSIHPLREYENDKKTAIQCAILRLVKQNRRMEAGEMEKEVIRILSKKYSINTEEIRRLTADLFGRYIKSEDVDGQRYIIYIG